MENLERWPIEDLESDAGASLARTARRPFLDDGLCVVPEFVQLEALEILAEEANRCIENAWF